MEANKHPQLKQEHNVYKIMKEANYGIGPDYLRLIESYPLKYFESDKDYTCGKPIHSSFNILVMHQLGRDLMDVFNYMQELNVCKYELNGSNLSRHYTLPINSVINLGRQ